MWWRSWRRGIWMIAVMVALPAHLVALTPAAAGDPKERVKETLTAVSAVLKDPGLQGPEKEALRKQRVRRIIFDTFDFETMAPQSLGPHWAKLAPQQRKEFVGLLGELFERSYNSLVLKFMGKRETIYGNESVDRNRALVQTILRSKEEGELPVDYRLAYDGKRWAMFDVVVDGVSLAENYRAQFSKIIQTSSYETLVQKMRAKVK